MTADLMLTKRAKNAIGELRTALLFVTLLSPCAHPRIEALFVSRESMWNRKSVLMESTKRTVSWTHIVMVLSIWKHSVDSRCDPRVIGDA